MEMITLSEGPPKDDKCLRHPDGGNMNSYTNELILKENRLRDSSKGDFWLQRRTVGSGRFQYRPWFEHQHSSRGNIHYPQGAEA